MITQEMKRDAKYYEGPVPESWELVGMQENGPYRFRYYVTPEKEVFRTSQKLKRKWEPKIDIRIEDGNIFASRDFKRGRYA